MNWWKKYQCNFDVEKYYASEKANKDLCGTYEFCCYCKKKNKNPCVAAKRKLAKISC